MKKNKKRKEKKARNVVVLGMLLSCKGGFMKHRCEPRKGGKNLQREFEKELD